MMDVGCSRDAVSRSRERAPPRDSRTMVKSASESRIRLGPCGRSMEEVSSLRGMEFVEEGLERGALPAVAWALDWIGGVTVAILAFG